MLISSISLTMFASLNSLISTTYNVPIGKDLDSITTERIDCFSIIEDEINKINKHRSEQDG